MIACVAIVASHADVLRGSSRLPVSGAGTRDEHLRRLLRSKRFARVRRESWDKSKKEGLLPLLLSRNNSIGTHATQATYVTAFFATILNVTRSKLGKLERAIISKRKTLSR